jgi:hypothetical protein
MLYTPLPLCLGQVLLPHSREIKIEGVRLSAAHMAIFERSDGLQASVTVTLGLLNPCCRCRSSGDSG